MRRIMPDSDSDSELDVDGIAQTELHKLQREFRIMVGSRQAYKAETEDIIRRQLQQIQSLQEEHKEILCNLRVIKGTRHRDKETSQDLCHMLAFQGGLETQIERERRNQKTIKQEIARLEKCIAKACERQKLLPELGRCSGQVLENKLDQRNKQCSMLLATNRKLREDLRLLHIDRNQFQHIHSKLEKELELIHRDIRDVMNKTTAAADGRFDMQLKTLILKDKMLKDMDQYNGQIGAFQRVIAHNDQLKNFMSIKGTERASQEDNSVDLRKQENEERREKGMDLEMSLKTIQRVTGEIEPQKIVERFRQGESWSFSLLKFVNEQNNQAEHIRDQISQILKEIDHLKGEWRLQKEEHAGVIRSLSSRQQQVERQRQATEQRSAALNKTLDQLKTGIYSLMQQTNCDRTAIDEQLGASCDNRESMIMAFLGLLEHRTNELLTVQSFLNIEDRKCSVSTTACHLLGKSQPLSQQELSVRPPPPWNESDEAEESELNQEEHVLSRETLHKHALKRMERRRTRPEVKSDSDRISLSTSLRRRSQALGLMSGSRLALP